MIHLEAAVGPNRAPALTVGAPPPGERVGSSWWQAIVPIGSIRDAFEAADAKGRTMPAARAVSRAYTMVTRWQTLSVR